MKRWILVIVLLALLPFVSAYSDVGYYEASESNGVFYYGKTIPVMKSSAHWAVYPGKVDRMTGTVFITDYGGRRGRTLMQIFFKGDDPEIQDYGALKVSKKDAVVYDWSSGKRVRYEIKDVFVVHRPADNFVSFSFNNAGNLFQVSFWNASER